MMFQEEYLFNPFMLETVGDDELSKQINIIASKYRRGETAYDVVFNINLESDLLTIYGEFIARFQEEYSLTKLEADNLVAKATYNLRKDWNNVSKEKPPAMSYFEAQAEDNVKSIREKQFKLESQLTRFKKAYSSLETKQNALKKKLEAMRYETV